MRKERPLTIYDISELAGVSIATVSRAINPATRDRVAQETFNRITGLVDKHGYTPSLAARHLSGSAVKTIGVLLPQSPGVFFNDYYVKVLAGISDALLETEYHFKLIMSKPSQFRDRYNFKIGEAVDGLIVTHWHTFFSQASVFDRLGVPCVVINDPEPHVQAHFVSGDHVMGGELAARYLYTKGHHKVAILTGPACSSDSRLRLRGFRRFFQQAGGRRVELTILPGGEFQQEKAREVAAAFLKTKPSITAFFCLNDDMALGVLKHLREIGRSCPKDFSIVGYDGDPRTETSTPSLTTVRVPLYDIAREAARRLVDHLKARTDDSSFAALTLLPVELVERSSVRRCR